MGQGAGTAPGAAAGADPSGQGWFPSVLCHTKAGDTLGTWIRGGFGSAGFTAGPEGL